METVMNEGTQKGTDSGLPVRNEVPSFGVVAPFAMHSHAAARVLNGTGTHVRQQGRDEQR
jgi:hypothetical protein